MQAIVYEEKSWILIQIQEILLFTNSKILRIITSAALPTMGNKINPTKVLLNPEALTIPSVESTKYLVEKVATKVTIVNNNNVTLRVNLGCTSSWHKCEWKN